MGSCFFKTKFLPDRATQNSLLFLTPSRKQKTKKGHSFYVTSPFEATAS